MRVQSHVNLARRHVLQPVTHAQQHLAAKNVVPRAVIVLNLAKTSVRGGKYLKTKLVATNATMNVILAIVQKELTGTNSGLIDVLLET